MKIRARKAQVACLKGRAPQPRTSDHRSSKHPGRPKLRGPGVGPNSGAREWVHAPGPGSRSGLRDSTHSATSQQARLAVAWQLSLQKLWKKFQRYLVHYFEVEERRHHGCGHLCSDENLFKNVVINKLSGRQSCAGLFGCVCVLILSSTLCDPAEPPLPRTCPGHSLYALREELWRTGR